MAIPIGWSAAFDLKCPCCGKVFTVEKEPITCPECAADLEVFQLRKDAENRVAELNGRIVQGDGIWILAFCKNVGGEKA